MNDATQDPQGSNPGGQQDSSGGTRNVQASVSPGDVLDAALRRLQGLTDDELTDVVDGLDAVIADLRNGPADVEAADAIAIGGAARILLRRRKAAAGRNRALSIVRTLTSATENDK